MKRLFLCNTPYQIMVASLLAHQLISSSSDSNDIIVTDNFVSSEIVFDRMRNEKLFKNCYFARIHEALFSRTLSQKIKKTLSGFFIRRINSTYFDEIPIFEYDQVFYNNDDIFLYNLVSVISCKNPNVEVFRYEEGYSSYIKPFCSERAKRICGIRDTFLKRKKFEDCFKGIYLFEPELLLYNLAVPVYKINRKISQDVRQFIISIFDIDINRYKINQDWIIFEESFYQNDNNIKDIEMYRKFIDIVGMKNVTVKLHPRSRDNRFKHLGINVLPNDGTPWEAILIGCDFKNIRFVALASGSIINGRLLMGNTNESFLLYKCLDDSIESLRGGFDKFIEKFSNMKKNDNLKIPNNLDEFLNQIKIF